MRKKKYLEYLDRPSVVVHLKGGTTLRGFLIDVYDDVIVLSNAAHVSENAVVALDGDQLIPKNNVDFMQHMRADA